MHSWTVANSENSKEDLLIMTKHNESKLSLRSLCSFAVGKTHSVSKGMKVAMIAAAASEIPEWIASTLRGDGIELVCRKCLTEDDVLAVAADVDVIWTFGANLVLNESTLPKLTACRAIFRSGSGVDCLPLAAAKELGIRICNSPESIAESVAEHMVALLFALIRRITWDDQAVRSGVWDSSGATKLWHISRRTLGLVGFGRIARKVVRMVAGFEMRVICYDPLTPPSDLRAHGVEPVTLDQLLRQSDYVSLHCPLTDETRHLLGEKEFAKMKPLSIIINTSRGGVIDEKALCKALAERKIGGAALDVTDPEPPSLDDELLKLDNVIVTPHVAAFSADFETNFWCCSVEVLRDLRKEFYGNAAQF